MIRIRGTHNLRVLLLFVCLFPWSVSPDVAHHTYETGSPMTAATHTPSSNVHDNSKNTDQSSDHTSNTHTDKETTHSLENEAYGDVEESSQGRDLGPQSNPPSAGNINPPSTEDAGRRSSIDSPNVDHVSEQKEYNIENEGQHDVETQTNVNMRESTEGTPEQHSDKGGIYNEPNDVKLQGHVSDKKAARGQYQRELEEQRALLLQQQQAQHHQQQQEEKDDTVSIDKTQSQRGTKELIQEERERLQQQKQKSINKQQQQQQGIVKNDNQPIEQSSMQHSHSDSLTHDANIDSDSGSIDQTQDPIESSSSNIDHHDHHGNGGEIVREVLDGEKEREDGTYDEVTHDGSLVTQEKEDIYQRGMELIGKFNSQSRTKGYKLLNEAANSGHTRALEQMAYARLIGSALERNFTWSYEIFTELADKGNPIGQQGLGFMYSTGIGVNSSQAKALLYYTFAALGGHHFSQMTMGYRSLMGISVTQSCETALYYYQKAAEKVADEVTLVTGGLLISKVRLMEEDNEATNVYGVSEDDMINYHDVFTDSGNTGAQVLLGVYYMFGMAGAERNFEMALKFLEGAAKEGFSAANALIGKIYAEGSKEVPKDYVKAMQYFKKASDLGHADGISGIGMLYFYGMGVEQSYSTALECFQKAVEKGSAEAQYYLGHMHYEGVGTKRNLNKALRYFQLASHGGHILAIYSLGDMHANGRAVKRNCNYAVELFKGVTERGKWTRILEDAERSYEDGDLDSALMMYLLLAEMGVEVAQTNAAYILEQDGLTLVHDKETLKRALILWNRSASQGYAMARVKLGDYYYYGQGTTVNYEAAASQYRIASDKQASSQAMFNLAYMYEQGYGLQKDYHLAKRYYDLAAETSGEANVPVTLALMKLNILSYYDTLSQVLSYPLVKDTLSEVEAVGGDYWDIYLITILSGLIALIFMWRWRYY